MGSWRGDRRGRGKGCALHGLVANRDGQCAMCREATATARARSRRATVAVAAICIILPSAAWRASHGQHDPAAPARAPSIAPSRVVAAVAASSTDEVRPTGDEDRAPRALDRVLPTVTVVGHVAPPPPPFPTESDEPTVPDDPRDFLVARTPPHETARAGGPPPTSPSELQAQARGPHLRASATERP
jgi:hypothetical protein